MTVKELQADFEKENAPLLEKGLGTLLVFPIKKENGMAVNLKPDVEIHPSTHEILVFRPFFFDFRKVPKTFHGFQLDLLTADETAPDELRSDEEETIPWHICRSPEKIIAYAEKYAVEICEELGDYSFTFKELCDMMGDGDFERYKQNCEDALLESILMDDEEFEDEDDFDEEED